MTRLGQHAFGVELHPLQGRVLTVFQAHDRAVLQPSRHFQALRQAGSLGDQAVVTGGGEGIGQTREHPAVVVVDGRGFAMHQLRGPHHPAAEGLGQALVAQAHPQNWHAGPQLLDHLQTNPCLIRVPRTWGDQDRGWIEALDRLQAKGIVAFDPQIGRQGMVGG